MIKVITYGTYDLLHYGHIRLLERAKALGDYLIVGVTADDFDKQRGKINVQQPLMARVEAVRATGIADEIIIEEYEGQKIDDIRRNHVDIFTVGSDWKGRFDYLSEFCRVVYLDRTEGVSSSDIRADKREIALGLVGELPLLSKFHSETKYVNGAKVVGLFTENDAALSKETRNLPHYSFEELLDVSEAVYIASHPSKHYEQVKAALNRGKHVFCESPLCLSRGKCEELFELAKKKKLILSESIKTAYATAYERLLLMLKCGSIGEIVSVDATCTSIRRVDLDDEKKVAEAWNSISFWGPNAMLPIFQILGTEYKSKRIVSKIVNDKYKYDVFSKVDFVYPNATASIKVGNSVKSEGELIVSGTKGYLFVPAPWWKTDYFEIRYENPADNKRYFYQLDGEGIRNSIVSFLREVYTGEPNYSIEHSVTIASAEVLEDFYNGKDLFTI